MSSVANPWSAEHWNVTAQGAYIKKYGLSVATRKASEAGVKIGDLRPAGISPPAGQYAGVPKSNFTVIVQRKGIVAPVGGGGLIGAGSSGTGGP